jgi:hypothetical protein
MIVVMVESVATQVLVLRSRYLEIEFVGLDASAGELQ